MIHIMRIFFQGNKKYGSIIMLTFAADGRKTAEEITKFFRSSNPKIGVIILQEQEKHVYCKAEEFIEDCFKQVFNFHFDKNNFKYLIINFTLHFKVNYIVPILTEQYLIRLNESECNEFNNLDLKYIRYIYSLMRYEYVKQDCINNRVR